MTPRDFRKLGMVFAVVELEFKRTGEVHRYEGFLGEDGVLKHWAGLDWDEHNRRMKWEQLTVPRTARITRLYPA